MPCCFRKGHADIPCLCGLCLWIHKGLSPVFSVCNFIAFSSHLLCDYALSVCISWSVYLCDSVFVYKMQHNNKTSPGFFIIEPWHLWHYAEQSIKHLSWYTACIMQQFCETSMVQSVNLQWQSWLYVDMHIVMIHSILFRLCQYPLSCPCSSDTAFVCFCNTVFSVETSFEVNVVQ